MMFLNPEREKKKKKKLPVKAHIVLLLLGKKKKLPHSKFVETIQEKERSKIFNSKIKSGIGSFHWHYDNHL